MTASKTVTTTISQKDTYINPNQHKKVVSMKNEDDLHIFLISIYSPQVKRKQKFKENPNLRIVNTISMYF